MKKCPYCAEEIQDDAIKCKHCGEWLEKKKKTTSTKRTIKTSSSINDKSNLNKTEEIKTDSLFLGEDKNLNIEKVYELQTLHKLIFSLFLGCAGLFLTAGGLSTYVKSNTHHSPGALFVGGCLIIACFVFLKRWYFNRGTRIQLLKDGLSITKKTSNEMKILWNEIEDVYIYVYKVGEFNFKHGYILTISNGTKINIDYSVKEVKELIQLIQNKIYELKFPLYKENFDKGETISFGKLSLSQLGIIKGNENISWQDIKKIEVKDDLIHIHIKSKTFSWTSVPVSEISKFFIFLSLVNENISDKMLK